MILIVIIIILILINYYLINRKKENFDYSSDCANCKNKGYHQCRNCVNCGVCTTATGEMYCVNGDISGPYNRQDCLKWEYGNIYPQYQPDYYKNNGSLISISNDARFYPYFKTLDDSTNSNFFTDDFQNNFHKNFNNTLKSSLYKR